MQKVAIYSILDKASTVFGDPWPALNPAIAVRNFRVTALDPGTMIAQCPQDFELYEVGVFDKEFGLMEKYEEPLLVISGEQVRERDEVSDAAPVQSGAQGGNSEKHVRSVTRS